MSSFSPLSEVPVSALSEEFAPTGGGLGGGTAAVSKVSNPRPSGGGRGSGTFKAVYSYEPADDEGVTVSGEAVTYHKMVFEQTFSWDNKATLVFSRSFKWDDGPQPMKWYRILGCCRFPTAAGSGTIDGEPIQPVQPGGCEAGLPIQTEDGKCQGALGRNTFIQNVAARNLTEVCENLKAMKWTWPICSISVFSQPADNRFVDPNNNCNTLREIPYCEIPACLDYCLHTDGLVKMGMEMKAEILNVSYFEYVGSGGVTAGGAADTYTSGTTGDLEGEASGGGVGGGVAEVELIVDTGYEADMGMEATIEDLEVTFSSIDTNANPLTADDDTISTRCAGCTEVPLQLVMTHNLDRAGVLIDFLSRNGETLATRLPLYYSRRLGMWQYQIHYMGNADTNTAADESWRILFEWACVDSIGSQELGSYVWKFGFSVVRKNLLTGMDFDTRILLAFPPSTVCANADTQGLDFEFTFNTRNMSVTTTRNVVPDVVLLYDNIGLFKSQGWVTNPNLKIRVAQTIPAPGFITQDISSIFPEPTIFQG